MKFIKLLKLILLFSLLITSQAKELKEKPETLKNPFLWSIKKDKQQAYLFGTMHIPSKKLSVLPKKLTQIIERCDAVRTEVDMSLMNQLAGTQLMLRKEGKSLKELISPALYQRTENYLKTITPLLNLEPFEQMKVWALSATLSLLKDMLKNPNLKVIDDVIFTYAQEQNKSIGGIETIAEQLGYFDAFSLQEQVLMLESTLDFLEKETDYMQEMKNLYIKGDAEALIKFTKEQFEDQKYKALETKFMEVLLFKRNKIMAERIDALLKKDKSKSYLFAFGTLHFLDKKSVITHLKSLGYSVSRIK